MNFDNALHAFLRAGSRVYAVLGITRVHGGGFKSQVLPTHMRQPEAFGIYRADFTPMFAVSGRIGCGYQKARPTSFTAQRELSCQPDGTPSKTCGACGAGEHIG